MALIRARVCLARPEVERVRARRDDAEIGGANRSVELGAKSARRVDHHERHASFLQRLEFARKLCGGEALDRHVALSTYLRPGGRRLRSIEIEDDNLLSRKRSRDGRHGGGESAFSGAAFLSDECDAAHEKSIHGEKGWHLRRSERDALENPSGKAKLISKKELSRRSPNGNNCGRVNSSLTPICKHA